MDEILLASLPQHPIKFYFRYFRWIFSAIVIGLLVFLFTKSSWAWAIASAVVILAIGFILEKDRFKKSVLEITDQRVLLKVKKGMFNAFEVGLHYEQIINCSYAKTNLFHALTKSGTLFIRASEKKEGQIIAEFVPDVERICRLINKLLVLGEHERKEFKVNSAD